MTHQLLPLILVLAPSPSCFLRPSALYKVSLGSYEYHCQPVKQTIRKFKNIGTPKSSLPYWLKYQCFSWIPYRLLFLIAVISQLLVSEQYILGYGSRSCCSSPVCALDSRYWVEASRPKLEAVMGLVWLFMGILWSTITGRLEPTPYLFAILLTSMLNFQNILRHKWKAAHIKPTTWLPWMVIL